jgi:hypothetical protein
MLSSSSGQNFAPASMLAPAMLAQRLKSVFAGLLLGRAAMSAPAEAHGGIATGTRLWPIALFSLLRSLPTNPRSTSTQYLLGRHCRVATRPRPAQPCPFRTPRDRTHGLLRSLCAAVLVRTGWRLPLLRRGRCILQHVLLHHGTSCQRAGPTARGEACPRDLPVGIPRRGECRSAPPTSALDGLAQVGAAGQGTRRLRSRAGPLQLTASRQDDHVSVG